MGSKPAIMLACLFVAAGLAVAGFVASGGDSHHPGRSPGGCRPPLLGVSASPQAVEQAVREFGHPPVLRLYYHGLPPATLWRAGPAALRTTALVISFRAPPSAISSGADDAALKRFFGTAPADHAIYYSYYHEPEGHIAAGEFTLAGYKAAWAHIVALARAAHNPNLHSTLILTSWTVNRASHRNFRDYLPPGHIISTLGWDSYPAGTIENRNVQLTPPAQFMGPEIAASKSVGLPYGFAEFALGTKAGRPAWLRQVGSYLAHSGAKFATYFNSRGSPRMELTDPASTAAWRAIMAQPGGRGRSRAGPCARPEVFTKGL